MEKYNKRLGIIFFILITIFALGSAYLINIINIQYLHQNKGILYYKLELVSSLVFGILLSLPDFFTQVQKSGIWFFNYKRFLIFLVPSISLGVLEILLINGSLFFNKITTYFLLILIGYSILSSLKRQDLSSCCKKTNEKKA